MGARPAWAECRAPVGQVIDRYDRPERAWAAKLAVNLMLLSGIATVAEVMTVGRAGGLTDDQLTDLLEDSPMLASGLKNRLEALVEGSGPTWWTPSRAATPTRTSSPWPTSTGNRPSADPRNRRQGM